MTAPAQPVLNYIAYDRFVADVQAIAARLEAGDWRPDFIVGIGRGGLVPGAYLSHRTGIAMLSVDYSSKVSGFSDELLVKLANMSKADQRILFVDDINDSGATLRALRLGVATAGGDPDRIRFATLLDNRVSIERVAYAFRTIDRTVDKDWFVFPWEAVAPAAQLAADAAAIPARIA